MAAMHAVLCALCRLAAQATHSQLPCRSIKSTAGPCTYRQRSRLSSFICLEMWSVSWVQVPRTYFWKADFCRKV